jgi:hypothetical protein
MPVLRNLLKTITPPARERAGDWVQHPDYFLGREALAKDDAAAAREAFLRVLVERPEQLDAKAGLALATYLLGDPGALAQVDEVLTRALGGTTELLRVTLVELGPSAEARALRPSLAWRVAQRLDTDVDGSGARPYYDVASRADGLMGLKARVRSLELDPEPTVPALSAAAELTKQEPELHKRVDALLRKFAPGEQRFIEMPPEDTSLEFELRGLSEGDTGAARPQPRIVPARLEGMDDGGLRVTSANGTNPLPFRRILGLAVGIVPATDGRNTVITDLVLSWPEGEKGSTILRLHVADLGLDRLYPGVPPKEAYLCWVRDVAARSGAKRLPPDSDGRSVPRYASPDEMTRRVHGGG